MVEEQDLGHGRNSEWGSGFLCPPPWPIVDGAGVRVS
jgi:hypothetical protein